MTALGLRSIQIFEYQSAHWSRPSVIVRLYYFRIFMRITGSCPHAAVCSTPFASNLLTQNTSYYLTTTFEFVCNTPSGAAVLVTPAASFLELEHLQSRLLNSSVYIFILFYCVYVEAWHGLTIHIHTIRMHSIRYQNHCAGHPSHPTKTIPKHLLFIRNFSFLLFGVCVCVCVFYFARAATLRFLSFLISILFYFCFLFLFLKI